MYTTFELHGLYAVFNPNGSLLCTFLTEDSATSLAATLNERHGLSPAMRAAQDLDWQDAEARYQFD